MADTILLYAIIYHIVPYYTVWYPTTLHYTIRIILYCIMLFHTVLYYTTHGIILYYTILYYTILYAGRPRRPPGPEVQGGLGGGHAPQRGVLGQSPPCGLNYPANRMFEFFKSYFILQ